MKMRSRMIPRTTITFNRSSGEYIDGIYTNEITSIVKVRANIQPYRGISLQSDKDAEWQKSSVILFSEDEIIVGDNFNYQNKNYIVKIVENFTCSNLSHFESIAHEVEE